jgi:DNA-binding NarL/FixJ family response regulator
MRVVIAEDQALLRESLAALLREHDIEIVAQVEDGPGLLRAVSGHHPDVAIVDVRLPPSFVDEGIRAALEARERQPGLGILILSQHVEHTYARELMALGAGGVGYLLKERIGDIGQFLAALRSVADGGTALDREVISELVRRGDDNVTTVADSLSAREREVLALMAEGRSNAAIARELVVTPSAVEKHVGAIFSKLDLPASGDDHRRVLAVLAWLQGSATSG